MRTKRTKPSLQTMNTFDDRSFGGASPSFDVPSAVLASENAIVRFEESGRHGILLHRLAILTSRSALLQSSTWWWNQREHVASIAGRSFRCKKFPVPGYRNGAMLGPSRDAAARRDFAAAVRDAPDVHLWMSDAIDEVFPVFALTVSGGWVRGEASQPEPDVVSYCLETPIPLGLDDLGSPIFDSQGRWVCCIR